MSKLSEEAIEAVHSEVRKVVQQELMNEVHEHRTFLETLNKRVIWATTAIFTVILIGLSFYIGKSVGEAKEEVTAQIDSKLIDYRIVESNRLKIQEFANIAILNSKDKINEELSSQLDSLVRMLNDTLIFLTETEVSETINDEMLEAIQRELEKIDQTNVSQTLVKSIESVMNGLKILREQNQALTKEVDDLRLKIDRVNENIYGSRIQSEMDMGGWIMQLNELKQEVKELKGRP